MFQELQAVPPIPPLPDFDTAICNGGLIVKRPRINALKKGGIAPKSQALTRLAKTAIVTIINSEKTLDLIGEFVQRQLFANDRDLKAFLVARSWTSRCLGICIASVALLGTHSSPRRLAPTA